MMSRRRLAGVIVACAIVALGLALWLLTNTLAVDVSPSGAGSVYPSGGRYWLGKEVPLTAIPASGYVFDHWSGDASGTSSDLIITMDSSRRVTANFKAATFTLTTNVDPWGAGSVSPSGGQYEAGAEVSLKATPTPSYEFASWSGDASGTEATITITMNSDMTITASFREGPEDARVVRVIDGDTIEVTFAIYWWQTSATYRVRYIGIDTPETVHPSKPVECFGKEASEMNRQLVEGQTVRLEKDVSETDRYGRLLRYVWVGNIFVNDYLVRQGYAYSSTYPPDVKYAEQFAEAQREAMENSRGLWAACQDASALPPPSDELSLQIVSVTSPVSPGAYATLRARAPPGAWCSITVHYRSGPSTAQGLYDKQADVNGNVSWTWRVGTDTTPGSWRIVVTAIHEGRTLSQETYLTVS